MRARGWRSLAACCGLLIAGCGGGDPPLRVNATPTATATPDVRERAINRDTLGKPWPLTVDEGTLRCESSRGQQVIVLLETDDGTTYLVNDFAKPGSPIRRIWTKGVSILPILEAGIALCDGADTAG